MPATIFKLDDYEITIDGKSVKERITGFSFQCDESSIHNSIDINFIDRDLYQLCSPDTNAGTARIRLSFSSRNLYFLIERRTASHSGFTCWGRSTSALLDDPFSTPVTVSLLTCKKASIVAQEMAGSVTVNWQVTDWVLPLTFSFSGTRIQGIQRLANEIEAIVKCEDDGSITVRKRYPVRPIDMENYTTSFEFNPYTNLIENSVTEEKGLGYDCIRVDGYAEENALPDLEVETPSNGSLKIGDDAFVRAYWGCENPPNDHSRYSTNGNILLLGEYTEDVVEIVQFNDHKGSVSKPIFNLKKVKWFGMNESNPTFVKFSKELYIKTAQSRIAEITYRTTYRRYRLHGSTEKYVIFNLLIDPYATSLSATVKIRTGSKEADGLNKPFLTDYNSMVSAGESWMDNNFYSRKEIQFTVPFEPDLKVGMVVTLEDGELSLWGKVHVTSIDTTFDGVKILQRVTAVLFKVN